MAKNKATSRTAKSSAESTTVTRITAADETQKKKKTTPALTSTKKVVEKKTANTPKKTTKKKRNVFTAFGDYVKGSWDELRQVRWPNRRTTWGLTLAVILFTVFFVVLIMLLDYAFQMLFERILG